MGNKSSGRPPLEDSPAGQNSTATRAISRGKIYVSIRFPKSVDSLDVHGFNKDDSYRLILRELQQKNPDLEIILDVGRIDRFCEHITFLNSNDPNKDKIRPRVLVEVLFSGVFSVNKELIKKIAQDILDPEKECYFDLRCEMGRYHTTTHLETLLRV